MATARVEPSSEPGRGTEGPLACVLFEIDVVRALGLAGIASAVAAAPGDPAGYSRHTKARLEWFDPWDETQKMLSSLMSWAETQPTKPILFYNGDHDLLMVSRDRTKLAERFDFVIAEERLVEDLVDKNRFYRLARQLDLPVPRSVAFDPLTAEPGDIDIDFPVIVKPATRRDDRWLPVSGGGKALRIEDALSLERVWPRLGAQGRVIAQTLIPGPESRIESYHVYVDDLGETLCEFTGRKIRTFPPEFGDTSSLEITDEPDVRSLGRDLTERMKLTGVAKFDFKRDPEGRLWLLEVNPRFNLWHHAGAVAGANIPAMVYRQLTGKDAASCDARPGVRWCHPTRDLRAARSAGMSVTGWARWAAGCEAKWAWSVTDPMPFLRGVIARRITSKLRRS